MPVSGSGRTIRKRPSATRRATSNNPNPSTALCVFGIDPGLNGTGVAQFVSGELVSANVLTTPSSMRQAEWWQRADLLATQLDTLVEEAAVQHREIEVYCELPHHFGNVGSEMGWKKGDLVKLTYLVGLFAGRCYPWRFQPVLVRDWKGQLPKGAVTVRLTQKLGRDVVSRVGVVSHAWDAVGVAMWALGRF